MKLRKNKKIIKKIFLTLGTFSVVGSSVVTAVACSSAPSEAEKYANMVINENDSVTAVLNYYYGIILDDRFKENPIKIGTTVINKDVLMKQVFANYIKWKASQDVSYWPAQYGIWTSGKNPIINSNDPSQPNYLNPDEFQPDNLNFGSSKTIDKDYSIMKSYIPTLMLQIKKISITLQYLIEKPTEVEKYFNIKESSADIDKHYKGSQNYFLTKWIQENKPSLAWQMSGPKTDPLPPANGTTAWNNAIRKQADKKKVVPFAINDLLNKNGAAAGKYIPNANEVDDQGNIDAGYHILNQGDAAAEINLDQIGGYLGLVTKSNTFGKKASTNGFDWDDNTINNVDNYGQFGFVGKNGITFDAIKSNDTSVSSSDGTQLIRSIVYQIANKATFHEKESKSKPKYYSYDLSGMMQDEQFKLNVMMQVAFQNDSMTDTAREYYWTLGYKLHVYNDALKKKLQGISNLLA